MRKKIEPYGFVSSLTEIYMTERSIEPETNVLEQTLSFSHWFLSFLRTGDFVVQTSIKYTSQLNVSKLIQEFLYFSDCDNVLFIYIHNMPPPFGKYERVAHKYMSRCPSRQRVYISLKRWRIYFE